MTQVSSAKSPLGDNILRVGQYWDKGFLRCTIIGLEVLPFRNANNNNTRVSYKFSDSDNVEQCTFLEFVTDVCTGNPSGYGEESFGLQEHHLTDNKQTIAVGTKWEHYKGTVYVITDVALDANVGVDDFNKARISYRALDGAKKVTWNLSVEEFLRAVDGEPRFEPLPRTGKDKRDIQLDRSLLNLWRISA